MNNNPVLTDVAKRLKTSKETAPQNVPEAIHNLCMYLSILIDNQHSSSITPDMLLMYFCIAINDIKEDRYSSFCEDDLKKRLNTGKHEFFAYMGYFPLVIDNISEKIFAKKFREIFSVIFGEIAQPPIEEKKIVGITIVEEGKIVDISNKDIAEVFSNLYNNARPQDDLGIIGFSTKNMSVEEARHILKTRQSFDYFNGRALKLDFYEPAKFRIDIYNTYNGIGSAEKIISQCKNIN